MIVSQLFELTFSLIMAYLILSNADSFSKVADSISSAYNSAVKTLQAR